MFIDAQTLYKKGVSSTVVYVFTILIALIVVVTTNVVTVAEPSLYEAIKRKYSGERTK
jgi:hypothetical protein